MQPCCCSKLASKHSAQPSFCLCQKREENNNQNKYSQNFTYSLWSTIDLNCFLWSIISNKLRYAFSDKTSAKQSAQLVCCSKSHNSNHTAQLSFCLKFAPKGNKLNLVQKTGTTIPYCQKAKTCAKHRGPLSCCSKLEKSLKRADNFEMSFSNKLVQNSVGKCAFARNWRWNTLRNCCFAWNWRHV